MNWISKAVKMKPKGLKATLKAFGSTTSMHGVPSLIQAPSIKTRLFWSLVCLSAMTMFVFLLVSLVIKYFSFPVNVKVDQVCHVVYSSFPVSLIHQMKGDH